MTDAERVVYWSPCKAGDGIAGSLRGCAMLVLLMAACSGAGCPQLVQQYAQPLPRVLPPNPSREQVIEAVNVNSAQIASLSSSRVTLSVPGMPSLRANLAFQRPRSFRLRGETGLTGPEIDLGSNDELFWFWVRRNQPLATYFCRHDQYAGSAARQVIPLPPEWMVQALGVVQFGPDEQHAGPFALQGGRVEIRSSAPAPGGLTRVTVVDDARGVVLEQHVYDGRGQRVASALMSRHQRDPASGVVLPRHVQIQWPQTHFELGVDLADVRINGLDAAVAAPLFIKPLFSGYPDVDLASLPPRGLAPSAQRPLR